MRCDNCKFAERIKGGIDNWSFISCFHQPYNGKWVKEIKDCPKEKEPPKEGE